MSKNVLDRIIEYNDRENRESSYDRRKYSIMAQNSFLFFRGTDHLFYEDLRQAGALDKGPSIWICGDLNIQNFGSYEGDNERVNFGISDFANAALAPVRWELARMICSIIIGLNNQRMNKSDIKYLSEHFIKIYTETLVEDRIVLIDETTATGIVKKFLDKVSLRKRKNLIRSYAGSIGKEYKLMTNGTNLFKIPYELKRVQMADINRSWLELTSQLKHKYKLLDIAFRVAGTGSIGIKRFLLLLTRIDKPKKFMLVDMKECKPSTLARFSPIKQPFWPSEAQRIIKIQNLMRPVPRSLNSAINFPQGGEFILQELQPATGHINFQTLSHKRDLRQLVENMALVTASSHLRSSGRFGANSTDHLIDHVGDGTWYVNLFDYCFSYSEQIKKYYIEFIQNLRLLIKN